MRVLVFEFITGGGFVNQPLPQSLLQEGTLMRNALLGDLLELPFIHKLLILQDQRLFNKNSQDLVQNICISPRKKLKETLLSLNNAYDAVWLIAPETEGILAAWTRFFTEQGKDLCSSVADVIELCQNKLETSKALKQAGIDCVPSQTFDFSKLEGERQWVVKSNTSVGCDEVYLIKSKADRERVINRLDKTHDYILQPYIAGKVFSLSCLFNQGQAYLLCCNEQKIEIIEQQFVLRACIVNVSSKKEGQHKVLCQKMAAAMPLLFGYIGIDLIETQTGELLVLEINPRLTSSFAGIKAAIGINVAQQVFMMQKGEQPCIDKLFNKTVEVIIS